MAGKIYAKVELIEKQPVSAQFDRLVFSGKGLSQFPAASEGGYIKLLFDKKGGALQHQPGPNDEKPVVRSFTITEHDGDKLAINVARGKNFGVAANWAAAASEGDSIVVVGPGKVQSLPLAYDSFFIVGDETAIPAIQVQLNQHRDASGYCIIQSRENQQVLQNISAGISLVEVDREKSGHEALIEAAMTAPWPDGKVYVWAACEFQQMRALRRYFRMERGVAKSDMYISSYWKLGETDEGNKLAKKLDTEANI